MNIAKIFRLIFIGLLPLVLFIGCVGSGSYSENILRYGNGTEPKDLDPHKTTGFPEFRIVMALLEGLITLNPETLDVIPGAAKSWKVSADLKTYTFKLRPDGRWSDGSPVTAYDFVYSIHRLLDPKTAAEYAYMAWYIKNARAFTERKLKDASKIGVKALDDLTIQFKLNAPTPFFLPLLNHHSLYPVHPPTVKKHGSRWTRPGNFVGNGPYVLKTWKINQIIEVVRNTNYWDRSAINIDEVHFYPTEVQATEERMFRAGKLDIDLDVPSERFKFWKGKDEYHVYPIFTTYFYEINVTRKALKDVRVRKALALTVDRKAIVEHVTKQGQVPAGALTPPGTAGFTPKKRFKYDPELARKLMAEAGYPGGKGFPKIEILYNTHEGHRSIAQAIQQMWKKELGIEIGIFNQEWKVFLDTEHNMRFDIARRGWGGDYPDPNTFLDMFVTGGGNNNTGWGNKEYDSLIHKASMTGDKELRYKYFHRAEEILWEEVPIIPIYIYVQTALVNTRLHGFHHNILQFHPYKFLSLD